MPTKSSWSLEYAAWLLKAADNGTTLPWQLNLRLYKIHSCVGTSYPHSSEYKHVDISQRSQAV